MIQTLRANPIIFSALLLLAPLAAVGCADGDGAGGPGEGEGEGEGDPVDEAEPLPQALIDAVNAAGEECIADLAFIEDIDPAFETIARDQFVGAFLNRLQFNVNDGLVDLDDAAVAACIADLASPVCENGVAVELQLDVCSHLTIGRQGTGDPAKRTSNARLISAAATAHAVLERQHLRPMSMLSLA